MPPGENPGDTDNQQGSLTEADLAWLAGYWDGDGWIGISKAKRSVTKKNRYSASVMTVTTSERIAHRVKDMMERLGCPVTSQYKKPAEKLSSWSGKSYVCKEKWYLTIRSNAGAKKFLEAVQPYLVEKGVCADLVLRYITWRETMPNQIHSSRATMIAREAESIIRLLRLDRERNDPPEAIRSAP
jgi:hypothetical protein